MAKLSALVIPVLEDGQIVVKTYSLNNGGSGGASSPEEIGFGYGVCSTAYITSAKVVTLEDYAITKNGIISVKFINAVNASATLNVNSEGAHPIYYRGQPIVAGIIKAGDTVTFMYDGSYYHLIGSDNPWKAEVQINSDPEAEITITNSVYGITDTVVTDSEGKAIYICKAPGTYVFSVGEN